MSSDNNLIIKTSMPQSHRKLLHVTMHQTMRLPAISHPSA